MDKYYACVNANDGAVLHTIPHKPVTTSSVVYAIDGELFGTIWKSGDTELDAISNALSFREKILPKEKV